MTKKLLTYCKLKIVKGFSKIIVSLFCRCVGKDDDSDGDRYYQYNNNCNFVYINVVK
ncbi:Mv-ORF55 peptide [Maruca vitrata nucleopolyhedrovirus]|uniref:Mv-ORF55 peptide n=1 Tax=Maruca vitrata nucleopolyhedrovirus TaxID=1307954 RepID=A1YRB7_9ABAC|nr:Mv-ORF55 peptide [Maruca vitrata nucleopolyhedrovirus]ABL76007.1 Mv-ORF55 peptide [Maruca vitrata nucleopolyhedrovirus]